jgi:xanthosine utilization system XapX-like protein
MKTLWFVGFIVVFLLVSLGSALLVSSLLKNVLRAKGTTPQEIALFGISTIFVPVSIFLTTRQIDRNFLVAIVGASVLSTAVGLMTSATAGGDRRVAARHLLAMQFESDLRRTSRVTFFGGSLVLF